MNLRPEQERALAYARRRGTEASLADIKSRVSSTYSDFEALVRPIPPGIARTRPSPSSWSVQEVVDHLVVSDRRAVDQLTELIAGESSEIPTPASLQSPTPLDADWHALVADFALVHQRVLALLDAASDDIPLLATARVEMVVKCATSEGTVTTVHWVQRFDWKAYAILLHAHNRQHIAQVQRTLTSLANAERGVG
ncbi:MAG TPA: DinB family protein [Thermoanaerobaculia bacterium]